MFKWSEVHLSEMTCSKIHTLKTFFFLSQTGIIAWGVECGINGVPGVYANVSDALCFIDYATKCVMGQDTDYYGLQGCQRWAKRTYCELQNSLQQYTDLVSVF